MIFLLANAEVPYRALDFRNVLLSCQSQYVLWLHLKVLMIDSQIVDLHGLKKVFRVFLLPFAVD